MDLEKTILYHFMQAKSKEPFFLALSRAVKKIPSTAVPTAGVRINPLTATYEMLYNPAFMASLTTPQLIDVYKHELYHLIFAHVTERLPSDGMTKRWNIATDLAINSFLFNLPDGCLFAGQPDTPWQGVPAEKNAEWYMNHIPWLDEDDDPAGGGEEGEGGEGEGSGKGDHSGWGSEVPAHVREMAREGFKSTLADAAQEANSRAGWGSCSHRAQVAIHKALSSTINWKAVLRYFIKTSQRASKRSTVRSINRRYPYIHPGYKVKRQAKIAISIDQSGSVCDKMLQAFFAELNALSALAEFTVIPFDCNVAEDKVFVWKRGERRKWERVMYGGTCFNAPTKYVNERQFDGHIILTDMYAPKPIASKCQRMWMTTPACAKSPYFTTNERVIAVGE